MNLLGLGYNISLTKFPLVVKNAVLMTSPNTLEFSPNGLAYITFVPPYIVYFVSILGSYYSLVE